jgi:iron(III) transport system permease protein
VGAVTALPDTVAGTGPPALAAGRRPLRRRGQASRPRLLWALSLAVALLLLLPIAFLVLQASQIGWSQLAPLLFRQLTATLLGHTLALMVVVTALCAVIGTATAFLVERTDLPGRRLWAVLLVLPVAIPDFVVGWGWVSIAPSVRGFAGATLVMTLAVYPLVFLPVAATLRRADPGLEEVSRGLGYGRMKTFRLVTLRQVRLALAGGCVVVALVVLAEYGAFEVLGYQTLTTTIFGEYLTGFNAPAACAFSLVLVLLCIVVLGGEVMVRGGGRDARTGMFSARPPTRHRLGRATGPALAGMGAVVVLALGVPVGAVVYWMLRGGQSTLPSVSIASAAWHTAAYSAGAGVMATAAALPVALLSVRHPSRRSLLLERSTFAVLAVPGLVIALSLTWATEHYAAGLLYQSSLLLMVAYAIMFFPLALVAVRASVAQAPPGLEEVGRSLGRPPWVVFRRVTLPLVAPGLIAAFCLVFLEAVTELTATLVLVPTGVQTLATQFWAFQANTSNAQAAPYAAVMLGIAVVPGFLLGRWFDRRPQAGAGGVIADTAAVVSTGPAARAGGGPHGEAVT